MPTLTLTARKVESLQPEAKRIEYFDTVVPGLVLRITPGGAKSWCVLYRHRGRLRRLTLAPTAVLGLADARDRARDLLQDARKGEDPAGQKKADRAAKTVQDLATLYLEKWAKVRKRSWRYDDNLLRQKVLPKWKHKAVADVTRSDVRELVEGIADAGAPITANRVVALVSKMFTFAVDRDLIATNPAVRIPRPGQEQARDRVLSEDELRALWKAIDSLDAPVATYFRLRLLTAQRGGEVASMRWSDVDLAGGWWTIPATVSKNKLAHRVPLAPRALKILKALRADAEKEATYVFDGIRGKRQRREAFQPIRGIVANFRPHDLRRTAASMMASGGVQRLVIAKLLNHTERGVTAVYDRHSYDAEKAAALTWWDTKIGSILQPRARATVRPFQRRR